MADYWKTNLNVKFNFTFEFRKEAQFMCWGFFFISVCKIHRISSPFINVHVCLAFAVCLSLSPLNVREINSLWWNFTCLKVYHLAEKVMVSQKILIKMLKSWNLPSFWLANVKQNIFSVALLKLKHFKDIKYCEIETCWSFFCALFCLIQVVGLLYFSKARTYSVRQNHILWAKSVCICWSAK